MAGHQEGHRTERVGWLRAAVLGADDGIVSTSSLVVGVAAAQAGPHQVLIAGVAGLVAGAFSMAAGEYVSVSSQADAERADLDRERIELASEPHAEQEELAGIYRSRGLDRQLAAQVAEQLTRHDALGAHARDELGLSTALAAKPLQAAAASAASFAVGGAVPLMGAVLAPPAVIPVVVVASIVCLAGLGALAARAGGARPLMGAVRVTFWGILAMAATALVGAAFGVRG